MTVLKDGLQEGEKQEQASEGNSLKGKEKRQWRSGLMQGPSILESLNEHMCGLST